MENKQEESEVSIATSSSKRSIDFLNYLYRLKIKRWIGGSLKMQRTKADQSFGALIASRKKYLYSYNCYFNLKFTTVFSFKMFALSRPEFVFTILYKSYFNCKDDVLTRLHLCRNIWRVFPPATHPRDLPGGSRITGSPTCRTGVPTPRPTTTPSTRTT